MLRNATTDKEGEERIELMRELAEGINGSLNNAISELSRDIRLNPRRFLGVTLYPKRLWGWFVTLATIGLSLFQQKIWAQFKDND